MLKKLKESIKYLKFEDLCAPFLFILFIIPAFILMIINKFKKRDLLLICESRDTARDNGYHLFKYIKEKYPNEYCFYAMDKKANDYKKIEKYGDIIQYGSAKHWIYYMAATYNISTQKKGNPSQAFWYFIHVVLGWFNNRIFLQHGITKDDSPWLYYKNTKFKMFICGAKNEYNYIKEKFGYPVENVKYTGFPRFDNLWDESKKNRIILMMPTWRNWLGRETNSFGNKVEFTKTEYYNMWNNLITDKKLIEFIGKNNYIIYFYPHINMQKYIKDFKIVSDNVKIIDNTSKDIQDLLKESNLLVTDFSSVFMDFAYMEKPMIYFQFDKEEYRKFQYQTGYFEYESNGFGDVCVEPAATVEKIIYYCTKDFKVEEIYTKRMRAFFEKKDYNNCERVYKEIKNKE